MSYANKPDPISSKVALDNQQVHTKTASLMSFSLGHLKERPSSAVIGGEKSVGGNTTMEEIKGETASYVSVSSIMKPQVSAFRSIDTMQRAKK